MIISVASGKGGTGKTLVATNLALSIGRKVQFLDCDVEEPDAHIFLRPALTVGRVVNILIPQVDQEKCNGCRECLAACPYGVPQFDADGLMQKCDFCISAGTAPACAASCPADALNYGPIDELIRIARQNNKQAELRGGEAIPAMVIVF